MGFNLAINSNGGIPINAITEMSVFERDFYYRKLVEVREVERKAIEDAQRKTIKN
jgi:hypothetical protein